MLSLRKLINKPKLTDGHPLAIFYYCDEAVNHQMHELNHLMKTTPDNLDRRATLIRQLKDAQHNLMNVIFAITQDAVPEHHTCRDFRAKYPDDVLVDQINGPLWFGAECIAAGSHILNHELESEQLRPFAVQLSKAISRVRMTIKEQCLTNRHTYSRKLKDMLKEFDVMWADFEFRYVGLMCSVKSERQYYHQQDVIVLFCESTLRALKREYIDSDMIEMMDPSIMFAIPRLAIVCGLVVCPDGPINPSRPVKELPPFFRGYQTLLVRIKELLGYLTEDQLVTLEKALCSSEGLGSLDLTPPKTHTTTPRPFSTLTTPSPLANATTPSSSASSSSGSSQSNPVTPNPLRRDVVPPPQILTTVSHQRSRSLGSHDLAAITTRAIETRDQVGLDLPSPSSPVPPTGAAGGRAEVAHDSLPSCEATCVPTLREGECFPQFEPDQPVVNDLPMATPIISPPLLTVQNDKQDIPVSSSSSPSPPAKSKQSHKTGRHSSQHNKGPAGFSSADDLMHRLFVAISGVADQLQTNHAKDLRVILKRVFAVCQSEPEPAESERGVEKGDDAMNALMQSLSPALSNAEGLGYSVSVDGIDTPSWVPDDNCVTCTACHETFSWKKRRHHCRSCGQVVCGRCSPHSLPLQPAASEGGKRRGRRGGEGLGKTVRVCNSCYLRQLGAAARISATSHASSSARPVELL